MREPKMKLGAAERETLVRAAINRIEASKRCRLGGEPPEDGPTFETTSRLVYKDPELEEQFMRFIHIAPVGAILVLHLVSAVTLVMGLVEEPNSIRIIFAPIFVVMFVIETYIHIAARRMADGNPLHRLLKIERLLISISMFAVSATLVVYGYQVLHDCDELLGWNPVGTQPKYYTEGYCQYWSGLISLVFGILAVLQVIRFSVLLGGSTIVVTLTATLWILPSLRPQHDDVAGVIVRVNLMTIAACGLACFIRYVDEKQQRRHFESQEKLMHSAEVLSEKRVATLERFLAVLPATVSKRLRDGQWQSSHIDVASDATVLVTRIDDFPKWSTSRLPLQVAALVAAMQREVASLLLARRLERVGRLGDTTVAVGNLLDRHGGNAAAVTIDVAKKIVMLDVGEIPDGPTILAAVHLGSVEGVLQGAHYVRYEVHGPAMEATRGGVQLCGSSSRLLGSTTIVAAATEEDGEWYQDSAALDVETSCGETVTFRRLDPQRLAASQETSTTEVLSVPAIVDGGDDGKFVSGVSRLLGHRSSAVVSGVSTSSIYSGTVLEQSAMGAQAEPLEIVTDRLGFYRFADEHADALFRQGRTKSVPQQAAKIWIGYAVFVLFIFVALLTELQGPYAVLGAVLIMVAALCSVCLAVVPSVLSEERMAAVNVQWTAIGTFVPLLTVFGCALSRPSIVGIDIRAYVAFGAFMRSYCFNDARLQAIAVPLFSLISMLQYLVPGAHENLSYFPLFLIFIFSTILAARNREGSELKNYRRGVIAEAVVKQIEETTRVQQGLLRSSLPRSVFEAAVAADFRGPRKVHQQLAVVMVIRAAAPSRPTGTSLDIVGGLGRVLDLVQPATHLSIAGVLGDDAVVVGPVPTSASNDDPAVEIASLHEALLLGIRSTESGPSGDAPALSVLVDQDTAAHVVELGSEPNYALLGISATRLICVGADVSGVVRGLLVTDRVTAMLKTSAILSDVVVEVLAPMSVRGQGVLRWNRIRKP